MTPRPTSSEPGGNNQPASTPPFHSRSTRKQTFYQPSLHTFTCRGAFHIKRPPESNDGDGNEPSNNRATAPNEEVVGSDLEQVMRDAYICNGIQTKLQHVADYPLARSKDDAVRWFQGQALGANLHARHADSKGNDRRSDSNQSPKKQEEEDSQASFSSYGTTQVNVLTVQEVPVVSIPEAHRQLMNDPFAGFGPLSPSGMMNPFGSIFGGFFGGGAFDPFDENLTGQNGGHHNPSSRGWMKGSRSVSSSTRTHRDENGKRIATTVTRTTIVDAEGNLRTETETITRHLDDGGRVETKKVIHDEKNDAANQRDNTVPTNDTLSDKESSSAATATTINPRPQVALILTDCRFGVSVSDSKSELDDSSAPKSGDASKWRKTQYLLKLGRFIPPLMVVHEYYDDKDEAERIMQQRRKEYDEERQRQKKGRWGKSADRANGSSPEDKTIEGKSEDSNTLFPVSWNLPIDNPRARYYLARIDDQIDKNINMMKVLLGEMLKPEFPRKVYDSGKKIYENIGPTAERTGKLMKDVFNMWVGGSIGWDNGGESGGGRKR